MSEDKFTEITVKGVRRIYRVLPVVVKSNAHLNKVYPKKKKVKSKSINSTQCNNSYCKRIHDAINSKVNGHEGFCGKKCAHLINKPRSKKARRNLRKAKLVENQKTGFYWSDEWRTCRMKTLRKYGYSCMACGRSPKIHRIVIHVDHIKPRSKYPALELDQDNLQVLCEDCNLGKSNLFEDDLRP